MSKFEDLDSVNEIIRSAMHVGEIALAHSTRSHIEVLLIQDGDARYVTLTRGAKESSPGDMMPEIHIDPEEGLRVIGVKRRHGIFRRFVATTTDFREGDKVAIQDSVGKFFCSRKAHSVFAADQ